MGSVQRAMKTRKASSLDVELGKKRYRELSERRK
jgi:phage-related protein